MYKKVFKGLMNLLVHKIKQKVSQIQPQRNFLLDYSLRIIQLDKYHRAFSRDRSRYCNQY